MGKAIVITGSVGVGKTTVSKLLAKKIRTYYLSLGEIAIKKGFIRRENKRRKTFIADLARLRNYVGKEIERSEKELIIEGHYASHVVPNKYVSRAFVLRLDPEDLDRRLEKMGMSRRKRKENVEAEVLDICLYDAVKKYGKKVCEIDTTGRKPEKVVEEILDVLEGKEEGKIGIVDWLGKLYREEKLDRFLG